MSSSKSIIVYSSSSNMEASFPKSPWEVCFISTIVCMISLSFTLVYLYHTIWCEFSRNAFICFTRSSCLVSDHIVACSTITFVWFPLSLSSSLLLPQNSLLFSPVMMLHPLWQHDYCGDAQCGTSVLTAASSVFYLWSMQSLL